MAHELTIGRPGRGSYANATTHVRRAAPAFDIVVQYTGTVPLAYQAAFAAAEATWELLLSGYRPGIAAGQLVISASFPAIDGPGGVLGQVGAPAVCVQGV